MEKKDCSLSGAPGRPELQQPMVRDRQKLLGRFVLETTHGHEQEIRVIGEGNRAMFDFPYNHIVEPENSDTSDAWHRESRLWLGASASELTTISFE